MRCFFDLKYTFLFKNYMTLLFIHTSILLIQTARQSDITQNYNVVKLFNFAL